MMLIQDFIIIRVPRPVCRYCNRAVDCSFDDESWGFTQNWRGEVESYYHTECMQEMDDPPELRKEW